MKMTGPFFDGRAQHAIDKSTQEMEQNIASRAVSIIQARLGQVLKHPTGNYYRHIRIEKTSFSTEVNDSRIVYGTWLEGISSRNLPKTRFAGYHTFERAYGQLEPSVEIIANIIIASHLGEMQ